MSTTTTFSVTGMTCGHCVNAVTEELSALPGVTAVAVDLDRDTVASAVDEAGYVLQ
jgi:copper chaperone CopZ